MSEKKEYWLALWWGSARWFVHIWVIKYLEENNVKITEIAWTSMWSIIWALLAFWKNSDEIIEICHIFKKYKKFLDIDLRYGLIKWEKVRKKLFEIFWDTNIEDLKIKLKIVATDIESWEIKVFEKWNLVDAIRASIWIPWFFKPYKIWKNYYVDGMVVKNLPIDLLEWENKIGVSATKVPTWPLKSKRKILWFSFHKSFFNLNYQIVKRSFINIINSNENYCFDLATWNKQLLNFEFWNLDFFHFKDLEKFIKIWYNWAKKDLKL